MGQGAAIIFATLFKCDIGQAQDAASNAIKNNFIFGVVCGKVQELGLAVGVRGAMEQATDLRNHMSFEDKHSFVFYSLRYLPFLK